MKQLVYAVALALILPATVSAQSERGVRFGFFGGLGLPASPEEFTDLYNGSFTIGGQILYKTSARTTIVGRVAYHRFSLEEEGLNSLASAFVGVTSNFFTSFSIDGGNARALAFTANVMQQLSPPGGRTNFFISAGAGLYSLGIGDMSMSGSYNAPFETGSFTIETEGESQTDFGINFGAGIDNSLGESASLLLEARYNMVFTDIAGVDNANFFTFLGGLSFRLGSQQ
jgi:hypothetical protein